MMTRRQALKKTAVAAAAAMTTLPEFPLTAAQAAPGPAGGPFKLPPLPYAADALEPHIDARTMELHHGKHHAAYVANLNKALSEASQLGGQPVQEIIKDLSKVPESVRTMVRNNGGGHLNHTLFWLMMKKGGGGEPRGELAKAIDKSFGKFAGFREKFTEAATKVFGSGWAWLIAEPDGTLAITSTPNQDSPLMHGLPGTTYKQVETAGRILLGLDVWEHAYYLKYQNRRADYIGAWFNVVNWDVVAERFGKAKG